MNVLLMMEIVNTTVLTLLVLITANAKLDINCNVISKVVKVICNYVCLNKMYACIFHIPIDKNDFPKL